MTNPHVKVAPEEDGAVPTDPLRDNLTAVLGDAAPELGIARANPMREIGAMRPRVPLELRNLDYTRAYLDGLDSVEGDAEWQCLTEALYFEARGEEVRGIFAVAEVILNRVDSSRFPATVCGVVRQGTGRIHQCQFSYFCDGTEEVVREPRAWRDVGKVARVMLEGAPRPLTSGAQFYHTRAVSPRWSRVFDRTVTIGAHHFYQRG